MPDSNPQPDPAHHDLPLTLGWREFIHIPQWGIRNLRAKVDTGAQSSAIDVADIDQIDDHHVRFAVVRHRHHRHLRKEITAPIARQTTVKSSSGHTQQRFTVEVDVWLGPLLKTVEFTLVCRHGMLCRVLIGRRTLENDFLVDPAQRYLISQRLDKPIARADDGKKKKKRRPASSRKNKKRTKQK